MKEFRLSNEAYDDLHPKRAAARRRRRELLAALRPGLASLWRRAWPIVALVLVFAFHAMVTRWDAEPMKPLRVHSQQQ